jgi:hypothetical protein
MRKQLLQHFFLFFTVDDDDPYVCMCRAQSWCHEVCTKFGPLSFTLFIYIMPKKSIPKRTQDKPQKQFPHV